MRKKGKYSEGFLDEKRIIRYLKIRAGQTILDAGCGNGYMAKQFSALVGDTGKIYALDPNRESIKKLRKEVEKTNIEVLVGDITKDTGIRTASVDLVYLSTVFHLFSDPQIAAFEKEVKRILKPRATLAIVNIHKENTPFGPPLSMRSSPEELRQKLTFAPKEFIEINEHFYMQIFVYT